MGGARGRLIVSVAGHDAEDVQEQVDDVEIQYHGASDLFVWVNFAENKLGVDEQVDGEDDGAAPAVEEVNFRVHAEEQGGEADSY